MKYVKIPSTFKVGGTKMEVRLVDRCDDNVFGSCFLGAGYIEIANIVNKNDQQSADSKVNTFYHELIHSILDTMGYDEMSKDEKFVNCFAGFLTEAMESAVFIEDEQQYFFGWAK